MNQIRNPKHEIRNKRNSQIRNPKIGIQKRACLEFYAFLSFEFVSNFQFRVSNFLSLALIRSCSQPFHGRCYASTITKNRRSGYENVGSCIDHERRSRRLDAAINLEITAGLHLIDHLADAPNLWQRGVDEMLMSKARVNRHD